MNPHFLELGKFVLTGGTLPDITILKFLALGNNADDLTNVVSIKFVLHSSTVVAADFFSSQTICGAALSVPKFTVTMFSHDLEKGNAQGAEVSSIFDLTLPSVKKNG
jgi:hypothetical protein